MYQDDEGLIHETAEEARDGVEVKGMTAVLGVSMTLVVMLFLALWWLWGR